MSENLTEELEELEETEEVIPVKITIDQVNEGDWVTIQNEKDNMFRSGFVSRIIGEDEATGEVKVELFDMTAGVVRDLPELEDIHHEIYLFYKSLCKNKRLKSPMHFKTNELLIGNWTTFRSQPRETVFEKVVFLATTNDPRHLVLDAEYNWQNTQLNEEFLKTLEKLEITSVNINSKYKPSLRQLDLIFKHFNEQMKSHN